VIPLEQSLFAVLDFKKMDPDQPESITATAASETEELFEPNLNPELCMLPS
jgi:hypothetical protein